MTDERHIPLLETERRSARQGGYRVHDDVLLDAARACVLAAGVRRTTLAEIARTAGVSRMTLYRRYPDVRSILAALMTREFTALLRGVQPATSGAKDARQRLVRSAVAAVRALSANELMRTVLNRDAEVILPYIVRRLGATQHLAEAAVAEQLEQGARDGSVRVGEPAVQARAVLLMVQSFAFSLRPATADVDTETLLSELAHTLDATLRPAKERQHK